MSRGHAANWSAKADVQVHPLPTVALDFVRRLLLR